MIYGVDSVGIPPVVLLACEMPTTQGQVLLSVSWYLFSGMSFPHSLS